MDRKYLLMAAGVLALLLFLGGVATRNILFLLLALFIASAALLTWSAKPSTRPVPKKRVHNHPPKKTRR